MRLPKIGGNWRGKDYQTPPWAPFTTPYSYTLRQPPETLRYLHTLPCHPIHILDIAKGSPKHLQIFLTLTRHHLTPPFLPEFPLTSPWQTKCLTNCLMSAKALTGCLVRVLGVPGGVLECPGVFWGVLEGVSMLWEVSGGIFYSIPYNTITQSLYYTFTLSLCHTSTLQHNHIIRLSHCHAVTLSYFHTTTLLRNFAL